MLAILDDARDRVSIARPLFAFGVNVIHERSAQAAQLTVQCIIVGDGGRGANAARDAEQIEVRRGRIGLAHTLTL